MPTSNPSSQVTLSFIVLALNEDGHIEKTFETVLGAAAGSRLSDFEVVLVDDGSTDRTGEIMDRLSQTGDNISVIHNPKNLGIGAAYLNGVKSATKEYIMIIAGDNIMPMESITRIVDMAGTTDMVLPYMTDDKFREPLRRYGSSGFTSLINFMSGHKIRYYNGMVVRRELFQGETIISTGYSLMAECVLKFLKKGATYLEIGVPHGYPLASKSNSKALRFNNLLNLVGSLYRIHLICRR